MPMLASFRANIEWDTPKGSFTWKVPINELCGRRVIERLVAGILEIHEAENSRPEYVGHVTHLPGA